MKKIVVSFIGTFLLVSFLTACLSPDYILDKLTNNTIFSHAGSTNGSQNIDLSENLSIPPTPLFVEGSINSDYVELTKKLFDDDSIDVTSPAQGALLIKTHISYSDTESFMLKCSAVSASIIADPHAALIITQFDGGIIITNWQGKPSTLNTTLYVNKDEPLKEALETAYYGNAIFNNYDKDK